MNNKSFLLLNWILTSCYSTIKFLEKELNYGYYGWNVICLNDK